MVRDGGSGGSQQDVEIKFSIEPYQVQLEIYPVSS